MNIKQIIAEAINKTVLKQYAVRLERYLGTTGIDTTPAGNNAIATKYINTLSIFAFQVKDAIESDNYKPAAGTTPKKPQLTQQTIANNIKPNKKNDEGLIDATVNYAADTANKMYGYARELGVEFEPLNGVMSAAQSGYNNARGITGNWTNKPGNTPNNQQPVKQQPKPVQRRVKTGVDLTTLMGNSYVKIIQDYRYINQTQQNILYRMPNVANTIAILEDIKNALGRP